PMGSNPTLLRTRPADRRTSRIEGTQQASRASLGRPETQGRRSRIARNMFRGPQTGPGEGSRRAEAQEAVEAARGVPGPQGPPRRPADGTSAAEARGERQAPPRGAGADAGEP